MPFKQGLRKKPRPSFGDATDLEGFAACAERYMEWMRVRNYSERTIETRQKRLRGFIDWCAERNLLQPAQLTKPILERYQRHLFYVRRKRTDRPLSFRTQRSWLQTVQAFFKWLGRQNLLELNPAADLELPRLPKTLPKAVLNVEEVERVLLVPDVATAIGLRDRAMLEVLYATGVRRSELASLKVYEIDPERGTLTVREGKGRKDRVIPIGQRALWWVQHYLDQERPELVVEPDAGWLFLTSLGERFAPDTLSRIVRQHVTAAELGKSGSCHMFRHTMATLMLEGGADIRHIQEILGHASLESTEIYTRVSIRKLKAIYDATHPGAKLEPRLEQAFDHPEQGLQRSAEASQTATAEKRSSPLAAKQRREDSE